MNTSLTNQTTWSPLRRFFQMLKLDRKDITYIYVYAIFAGLITLSLPLGIQAIISLIAGGTISTSLIILILIVTIGTALTGILKVMQLVVTETLQRRIFARSAMEFAFRIPRLSLEGTLKEYPPELVNRFFDTLTLQKGVPKILVDFSTAVLQILFGLLLISFYHPFFVFFSLILITLVIIIMRVTGPRGLKTSLMESKYKYKVAHWLEEIARTMTTFKLAGGSDLSIQTTDKLVTGYLDSRKKHFSILLLQYGNIVAFKTMVTGALLFLGSYLVVENRINIGQFVAAEIVVILILSSVEKLILSMETIYDVLTAVEKIGAVTDLPLEQSGGTRFEQIDTGKGMEVKMDHLKFQFPDSENATLKNISLHVKSGEKVCIAGYNRSGKSTLIKILSGFYTSFNGMLNYNGFPMRSLDLSDLRKNIGDHSPEEDIFEGDIIQNICLGHESIGMQDVIYACEQVGLNSYIEQLPKGYQTNLIPGGSNVPRSIRAKIILARGIVKQPRLLVMEEFFTHLPLADREQISHTLTRPESKWTLIAVTNDPTLASKCDRILIMQDGQLLEEGSFEQIRNSEHFPKVFKTAR